MKIGMVLITFLVSVSGFAQTLEPVINFSQPQALFLQRCGHCHGNFETVPKLRFLMSTATFFDLKNGGHNQRVPPRMSGVRITPDEAVLLREWVRQGALDGDSKPTITAEQAAFILK